jgi:hypothetical protein
MNENAHLPASVPKPAERPLAAVAASELMPAAFPWQPPSTEETVHERLGKMRGVGRALHRE